MKGIHTQNQTPASPNESLVQVGASFEWVTYRKQISATLASKLYLLENPLGGLMRPLAFKPEMLENELRVRFVASRPV